MGLVASIAAPLAPAGAQSAGTTTAADIAADLNGNGPVGIEAWIYPGQPGQATCNAPSELAVMPPHSLAAVKPQYLKVSDKGTVSTVTSAQMPCNGFRPSALRQLRHAARQVLVTVAAGPPGVGAVLASAASRTAAEQAIVAFVSGEHLGGVELDFQPTSWSSATWSSYMTLVAGLVAQLGPNGGEVEVDLPAWTATPPDAERYADPVQAGARLVVMAMDHQYVTACSPIAPYSWLRQVVSYVKTQVPLSQAVLGLPSYGYRASDCSSTTAVRDNIPYLTMEQQPGFPAAADQVAAHRDRSSGEIRWKVGQVQYDYVDATALRAKLRLVERLGVTGVSVWSLGGNPWFTANP